MKLTPNEFAKELPKWYCIYKKHNPDYFLLEERLTQKAHDVGYLEMQDLVAIAKWGGNQYNRVGKLQRANTDEQVITKTGEAIQNLDNPRRALAAVLSIKQWGLAFGSKTLRCVCPQNYVALDSKLHEGINRQYFPSSNEVKRYLEFLNFCEQIRQEVSEPGPLFRGGEWFIADIEIALFQFVWDENNKIV